MYECGRKSRPLYGAIRGERLKTIVKRYVVGLLLSGTGTLVLNVGFTQILDSGDTSATTLMASAWIAAVAGAFILVAGTVIAFLAACFSVRGSRLTIAKPVAFSLMAPIGVALSLAFSFGIGALFTWLWPDVWVGWIVTLGIVLVGIGVMLTQGFWSNVLTLLRGVLHTPPAPAVSPPAPAASPPAPAVQHAPGTTWIGRLRARISSFW